MPTTLLSPTISWIEGRSLTGKSDILVFVTWVVAGRSGSDSVLGMDLAAQAAGVPNGHPCPNHVWGRSQFGSFRFKLSKNP